MVPTAHLAPDVLNGVLKADFVKDRLPLEALQGLSKGPGVALGQELMAAEGPRGPLQHSDSFAHKQDGFCNADRHAGRQGLHGHLHWATPACVLTIECCVLTVVVC